MEPSGDYYQQFLTSISGVGPDISSTPSPQDAHPPQFGHQSAPMPLGRPPVPSPYHHFGYFSGFPDGMVFNTSGSQRVRRKSAPGFEHIKHRRTRSGCYTCRSRRVKCDEGRPICARCKKGKRDCVYPEPTAPKQSAAASRKGQSSQQDQSPDSSHDDEEGDTEQESKLDTILDEEEQDSDAPTHPSLASVSAIRRSSTPSASGLQRLTVRARRDSETPSAEGNKSSSPATSTGTSSSLPPINLALPPLANFTDALRDDWTRLPQDVRFYLSYFHENVTHYHYAMVSDSDDFFRTILPSIAIHSDSLLYALVAFSAYHYALNDPNGNMSHFLQFYNQSVRLLLKALKKRDSHDIATLLTILQLATIEEYLGDWVNVMGHQKAAFELLTRMFVPESVMQSPPGRMSLSWYSRFDVFVGLMGSFETILPERWFLISLEYYQAQTAHDPQSVGLKFEEYSARLRLISMRMANIYGRRAKGLISDDVYATQHKRLNSELQEWRASWDPAIASPELLVKDFPNRTPLSAGDIVDPFAPGVLYAHPAFPLTVLGCEWHSIMMMHQCQSSSELSEQHMTEMTRRAYAICQAFATIEQWPYTPQGALTMIQSCIGIATLFLPQDERHHMWIRRRYARIESLGYIIPATTRKRMAELFRDQSCVRWWLPDDDGFTPLLKNLRSFADERNATVVSAQKGNLREIRHVFSRMRLRGTDERHQTPESEHGSLAGSIKGKGKALD